MTVAEIARAVLSNIATDGAPGAILAEKWVADRYRRLCSRARFRHLRLVGELTVPGCISAGTATFTEGLDTVSGDATAQAAWAAAGADLAGRHIRCGTAGWYQIASYHDARLWLRSAFVQDTATATGYVIAARYVALPESVRWLGTMVHTRMKRKVDDTSIALLDMNDPGRTRVNVTSGPTHYAEVAGSESSPAPHAKLIEVWPAPANPEVLAFVYWNIPTLLTGESEIPPTIDAGTLEDGAMIDAFRHLAAKAMQAGDVNGAGYWRNEYRAQETIWERRILEAVRADRGVDDISFILQQSRGLRGPGEIRTARDHVWWGR